MSVVLRQLFLLPTQLRGAISHAADAAIHARRCMPDELKDAAWQGGKSMSGTATAAHIIYIKRSPPLLYIAVAATAYI